MWDAILGVVPIGMRGEIVTGRTTDQQSLNLNLYFLTVIPSWVKKSKAH
jgi:hypothetical protein